MDLTQPNVFVAGAYSKRSAFQPLEDNPEANAIDAAAGVIEPWLSSLLQSEHLALLVGNGLTRAVASALEVDAASMNEVDFAGRNAERVKAFAKKTAETCGRGEPNIEDQLRAAQSLIEGYRVVYEENEEPLKQWLEEYQGALTKLMKDVLATEERVGRKLAEGGEFDKTGLLGFLLAFASRPRPRERLEVFTTNYDRLIEHACDMLGIRILDRFVGTLQPAFRSSRVQVDLHYDPPGIRGEPRYLEGVLRLTKLHGSLDWRLANNLVVREALPFGASEAHPGIPVDSYKTVMIYPNAAKDVETLSYPYADLFRDFAASLCRPNTTLFVYGYSFGDDHINRVIKDMLTLPSTHLVIIARSDTGERLSRFVSGVNNQNQLTVLKGKHFADLKQLAMRYIPHASLPVRRPEDTTPAAIAAGGVGGAGAAGTVA
ncbi:MAG: SIR2 family protein [Planctomycetes bacterium]|nr:SIR2 family protein [Planctomycetota bacterium]MCW8134470.1 SIR2 family protein [Planctomycetota bacterium]